LPGGQKTDIDSLSKEISYVVPLPESNLANPSNVSQVWVTPSSDAVALMFRANLTILMWPNPYGDRNPADVFRESISNDPAKEYLTTINGHPALAVVPGTALYNDNPAYVEFVRSGIDINLMSDSMSETTLIDVAQTIQTTPAPLARQAGSN
jgi:hypothetical protein